jgi:TPR repeat protein
MKRLLLLALLAASPSWAAPIDDARAANAKGDYATQLRITRPLAAQGEEWAQVSLGDLYANGQGVVQDNAEAVKWWKLASAQGSAIAQSNLGNMYASGRGIVQDYVRAHMWFNLAAVSGNKLSIKNRDVAAGRMTPQQIGEAQKLARECQARQFKNCN